MTTDPNRRTALYRLRDADGRLLYIGIAFNPQARWHQHASESPWWWEVASREVEWIETRGLAVLAEAVAIKDEKPLHNEVDNQLPAANRKFSTPRRMPSPPPSVAEPWTVVGPRTIAADYEDAVERLREARDEKLRAAIASGRWRQADLIRLTGYSREAMRQALNPEIRQAVKARRAAKS